jgi:hypothetical protein
MKESPKIKNLENGIHNSISELTHLTKYALDLH